MGLAAFSKDGAFAVEARRLEKTLRARLMRRRQAVYLSVLSAHSASKDVLRPFGSHEALPGRVKTSELQLGSR